MQQKNIRINDYQYFVLLFEQASVQKQTNGKSDNGILDAVNKHKSQNELIGFFFKIPSFELQRSKYSFQERSFSNRGLIRVSA